MLLPRPCRQQGSEAFNPYKWWCADVDFFRLPPPKGVSKELREWMVDAANLETQGDRLIRLKAMKAKLPPTDAHGAAHQQCHPCASAPPDGWFPVAVLASRQAGSYSAPMSVVGC